MEPRILIIKAKDLANERHVSDECTVGEVGCILVTERGKEYAGVSLSAACGIGFCAEHSAIAAMVTEQEYRIAQIVAVAGDGTVLSPCGRCRELMYQINRDNLKTEIILGEEQTCVLEDLLPKRWQEVYESRREVLDPAERKEKRS